MVIRLDIEIWKIGQGGTKRRKGMGEWGKRNRDCCILWPLCVFGYISVVVVKGTCVRDCRGL
jgi:hypothetical protein